MKRYAQIISLVMAAAHLLSGCDFWMDGSYVSVKPHQEQNYSQEKEVIQVATYSQIEKALCELVETGASSGVLSFTAFNAATARVHMESAISYVTESYPIGAYGVSEISYEIGKNRAGGAIAVSIKYRQDRSQMLRVKPVLDMDGAKTMIMEALNNCEPSVVCRIQQYEETDFVQLVRDYAAQNPDRVMERPEVSVTTYPPKGHDRIVELKFTYETGRDSLRQMQQVVEPIFTAAELYVKGNDQIREKYSQLYVFLMERYDYTVETSITPAYSLLHHGVGDCKAFATVYAAMCKRAELECYVVSGTRDGEPWTWNIIYFRGGYYHLDLLRCRENGRFEPMKRSSMEGYVWDYSAYPD